MYPSVRDPIKKVQAICEVLAEQRPDAYRLLLQEDRIRKDELSGLKLHARGRLEELLGVRARTISNWESVPTNPNPGLMLCIAIVGGFGPDQWEVDQLVEHFHSSFAKEPFPHFAYNLMELWEGSRKARSCWNAFVGTAEQISTDPMLRSFYDESWASSNMVGVSATPFRKLYETCVSEFTLKIPAFDYSKKSERGEIAPLKSSRAKLGYYYDPALGQRTTEASTPTVDVALNPESRATNAEIRTSQAVSPVSLGTLSSFDGPSEALHPELRTQFNLKSENVASNVRPTIGSAGIPECVRFPPGLQISLPTVDGSDLDRYQRFKLFGGGLQNRDLWFSPLQQVVAGNTFERSVVDDVVSRIGARANEPLRSMTIRGQHGSGISLAFAQVVERLHCVSGLCPVWVLGDPDHTREVLQSLSVEVIRSFQEDLLTLDDVERNFVFVFDDVSEIDGKLIGRLQRFAQHCGEFTRRKHSVSFTFLYGIFGDFPSIGNDGEFVLELTEADEISCYHLMASGDPLIVRDGPTGLSRIQHRAPTYRSYKNDVQGFIDFVLEEGERTKVADENWMGRVGDLTESSRTMLENVAASELIGLSLHENVALDEAIFLGGFEPVSLEHLQSLIPLLTITESDWRGLSLASPRRSRSFLKRLRVYDKINIGEILSDLFYVGMKSAFCGESNSVSCSQYSRHILQRLGKREFYDIPGRYEIALAIFAEHYDLIRTVVRATSAVDMGRWAGTLAGLLPFHRDESRSDSDNDALAQVVHSTVEYCNGSLNKLNQDSSLNPELALSLARASRRATLAGFCREECITLCRRLAPIFRLRAVLEIVDQKISEGGEDVEYRVNEIIFAVAQFRDHAPRDRTSKEYNAQMYGWFKEFERHLHRAELNLDAGSWLQRSKYTFNPQERLLYLGNAQACAEFDKRRQGTWARRIAREIAKSRPG